MAILFVVVCCCSPCVVGCCWFFLVVVVGSCCIVSVLVGCVWLLMRVSVCFSLLSGCCCCQQLRSCVPGSLCCVVYYAYVDCLNVFLVVSFLCVYSCIGWCDLCVLLFVLVSPIVCVRFQ